MLGHPTLSSLGDVVIADELLDLNRRADDESGGFTLPLSMRANLMDLATEPLSVKMVTWRACVKRGDGTEVGAKLDHEP